MSPEKKPMPPSKDQTATTAISSNSNQQSELQETLKVLTDNLKEAKSSLKEAAVNLNKVQNPRSNVKFLNSTLLDNTIKNNLETQNRHNRNNDTSRNFSEINTSRPVPSNSTITNNELYTTSTKLNNTLKNNTPDTSIKRDYKWTNKVDSLVRIFRIWIISNQATELLDNIDENKKPLKEFFLET